MTELKWFKVSYHPGSDTRLHANAVRARTEEGAKESVIAKNEPSDVEFIDVHEVDPATGLSIERKVPGVSVLTARFGFPPREFEEPYEVNDEDPNR